jgi:hypothetical protein
VEDDREPEGGDPACWLDRVCPECGSFLDDDAPHGCDVQQASSSVREGERR